MRDTVNFLFRALGQNNDDDGIPRSGGERRERKRKADVLEHNEKSPVRIRFRINIDVGDVQTYVYSKNRRQNPGFLVFNYVPHTIVVLGNTTDNDHEFIEKFEESKPSFDVSLDTTSINNHRNIESVSTCRIQEINIKNKTIYDIVVELTSTSDSPATLSRDRETLSFNIYATLTPEQTLGKHFNF
tara:strand:+ start:471 stop:1028 length:558 start_codon:yes stop_codon:yes gene_type:complete